ncbi:MAG: hypothetical protein N2444_00200 [Methylocystis sp.]|nr:hypothetical protein [Methylocystis sp.]
MTALTFDKIAAQGELTITRLGENETPKKTGNPVAPVDGVLIVGHSETGHHHVVDADCATLTRVDEFTAYLSVSKPTELRHLREFDTHQSIALQPGMYEFRTGREFDPFEEVIRASAD